MQLDETDTKNESYICFRRREIKAIRKTRAQQATYSDKMTRLQSELTTAFDLANGVLRREVLKRDAAAHGNAVWDKRCSLVDLKRRFPSLGTKEDEDLFYDKERVAKKPKAEAPYVQTRRAWLLVANARHSRLPLKIRTRDNELPSPAAHAETAIRPKERLEEIQAAIIQDIAKRKEKDQKWEDYVDVRILFTFRSHLPRHCLQTPYQPHQAPYPCRLYRYLMAQQASSTSSSSSESPIPPPPSTAGAPRAPAVAGRLRVGRGGRLHLDRRYAPTPAADSSSSSDEDHDLEEAERERRVRERWRYDVDDAPAVGPEGPDEKDRILVDDYAPK